MSHANLSCNQDVIARY